MIDDEDDDALRNNGRTFELAPREKIRFLEPLAREFLSEVFDIDFDECLITDESCVCDFATEETGDYRSRARRLFGVDVPKHAPLVDVLTSINRR